MTRAVAVLIAVAIVIAAELVVSGRYDVAASAPEWRPVAWTFAKLRDRSIAYHSAGIEPPALDEARARAGAAEYHEMCLPCHGAPGREPFAAGQGLRPAPPDLWTRALQIHFRDAELFWILKHGIRMTGMPAFGATHDDATLWNIVAFVRRLPTLDGAEYAAWTKEAEAAGEHHHAEHASSGAHHGPDAP